jgi:ankyrin repeat protein
MKKQRLLRQLMVGGTAFVMLVGIVCTAVKVCTTIKHHQTTLRLAKAVRDNNPAQVRRLLAAGGDPNAPLNPSPLSPATVYRLLFHPRDDQPQQDTLVLYATQNDADPVLQSLLEAGGSVDDCDASGHSVLMLAATTQQHRKIRLLVQHGADVNDSHLLNMLLAEGMIFVVNPEDIAYLLDHGADPNDRMISQGNISTPLTTAALLGDTKVIQALLRAGADINIRGLVDATPLMVAALFGRKDAVVIFLNAGADKTLHDQDGKTAEQEAAGTGHKQIAQIIHNYHAPRRRP